MEFDTQTTPLIVSGELPSEEQILAYSANVRKSIVDTLISKGVPTDPDMLKLTLQALKDMDSHAVSRKRIKVEEKQQDNNAYASNLISQILLQNTNRTNSDSLNTIIIPTLPSYIESPILVEGELDEVVHNSTLTYDSFISKFNTEENT